MSWFTELNNIYNLRRQNTVCGLIHGYFRYWRPVWDYLMWETQDSIMSDKERDIKDLYSNGSSVSESFDDHNYGPKDQYVMSPSEDWNQSLHHPCWLVWIPTPNQKVKNLKLICCSIPDLINVSHVRREKRSQLHSKHLKYGFKLRQAENVEYSEGMTEKHWWMMAGVLEACEAAERHLPKPVSCFVYPLYFHIFMASTFKLNVFRIWCLRLFSCVRSAHVGAGRELALSQLWPIVFPLAESTSRPGWN